MERLTRKCNNTYFYNVDDVFVVGKRLGAFEDFMEEQDFESLEHLAFTIEEQNKIIEAYEQENQALKDRWQKLKEWVVKEQGYASMHQEERFQTLDEIKDKMQELEKE